MSATLSNELRKKHGIRSLPVRRDDEVEVTTGANKGVKGKVTAVYRKRNCIYIEKLTKNKLNGKFPFFPPRESSSTRYFLQDPNPPK